MAGKKKPAKREQFEPISINLDTQWRTPRPGRHELPTTKTADVPPPPDYLKFLFGETIAGKLREIDQAIRSDPDMARMAAEREERERLASEASSKKWDERWQNVRGMVSGLADRMQIPGPVRQQLLGDVGRTFTPIEAAKPYLQEMRDTLGERYTHPDPVVNAGLGLHRFFGNAAINQVEQAASPGGAVLSALDWADATPGNMAANLAFTLDPNLLQHISGGGGGEGGAALAAGVPLGGTYSRIDKLLARIGKAGVTPGRLSKLIQTFASPEEAAFRKLPELIASAGPITSHERIPRATIEAHLAEHPAPQVEVTRHGPGPRPTEPQPDFPVETSLYQGRNVHYINMPHGGQVVVQPAAAGGPGGPGAWRIPGQPGSYETEAEALAAGQRYAHESYRQQQHDNTRWGSYTLPGGEDYRENLLTLDRTSGKLKDLQAQYEAVQRQINEIPEWDGIDYDTMSPEHARLRAERARLHDEMRQVERQAAQQATPYQSGHWDPENVLVHTRTKEREGATIVPPAVAEPDPSGQPGLYRFLQPAPTTLGPGRFLEEIQSDWFQQGARQGYASPTAWTDLDAAKTALDEAKEARSRYRDQFEEAFVPSEYTPPTYEEWLASLGYNAETIGERYRKRFEEDVPYRRERFVSKARTAALQADPKYAELTAAQRAAEEAHDVARRAAHSGVPDAPFKDPKTWGDLALKQQLLDVAHNYPNLGWLGFTSAKTQNERNQLAHYVSKLEYDPRNGRLLGYDKANPTRVVFDEAVDPDQLDRYVGRGPAEQLRARSAEFTAARQQLRDAWQVTEDRGRFSLIRPDGSVHTDYYGRPATYYSAQEAHNAIDYYMDDAATNWGMRQAIPKPTLEGLDLKIGKEGMDLFYDQILPSRLQKLLEPFGGKVERGTIPTTKEIEQAVPAGQLWEVIDETGESVAHNFPTEAAAEQHLRDLNQGEIPDDFTIQPYQFGAGITETVQAPVEEPAWLAKLTPEMLQSIREKGFPLLALGGLGVGATLAGDEEGGGANLAGVPYMPTAIGGIPALGVLAKALRQIGAHEHELLPEVIDRFRHAYEIGQEMDPKADWRGAQSPYIQRAFASDKPRIRLWGDIVGATSPTTQVPRNIRESVGALAHMDQYPGREFKMRDYGAVSEKTGQPVNQVKLYNDLLFAGGSKYQNLNRLIRGEGLSGEKVIRFGNFVKGRDDVLPLDRHVLYGFGAESDKLADTYPALREYLGRTEGLTPKQLAGPTGEELMYQRVEDALIRALQPFDPNRSLNPLFGDVWEGIRGLKGQEYQGGPADILRTKGLLDPGAMTDWRRMKEAYIDPSNWIGTPPSRPLTRRR